MCTTQIYLRKSKQRAYHSLASTSDDNRNVSFVSTLCPQFSLGDYTRYLIMRLSVLQPAGPVVYHVVMLSSTCCVTLNHDVLLYHLTECHPRIVSVGFTNPPFVSL